MPLVFEDAICGYEHHRHICIYTIRHDKYFYREYASDCGQEWFNCGFLDSNEVLDIMLEFEEHQHDENGGLL